VADYIDEALDLSELDLQGRTGSAAQLDDGPAPARRVAPAVVRVPPAVRWRARPATFDDYRLQRNARERARRHERAEARA